MKIKKNISKLSIVVIMLIMTMVSSNLNWGKDHWKGIIEADGKGYYAYLPAIFIYSDLNFSFFESMDMKKYYDQNLFYDYRSVIDGKVINKYYCGTALVELPFFLTAHGISKLSGYDCDGYSKLYPIFISIAALFYLLLGLIFINRSLKTYNIGEWQKALTLFAAVFGTNLFYYTVGEPGMSHVYSFAFISMFFYFARKYFMNFKIRYVIILSVLLGIIVLIRPVNGLILFILPFAAGSIKSLGEGFTNLMRVKLWLIAGIIALMGIVFLQLLLYKISTGEFFVYSYQQEGFNFLSPHMIDILFSYKKGLFLYTPLYLISMAGAFYLWKSSRFSLTAWMGFFLLITYVLSSWWMWYYGGSFSSRVYVEYIPLFMILLALALNHIKFKWLRRSYVALVFLLIILCQIQTYQYRYFQIHWVDMNKEKYWDVFLKVG
jgi:hypothetical protein